MSSKKPGAMRSVLVLVGGWLGLRFAHRLAGWSVGFLTDWLLTGLSRLFACPLACLRYVWLRCGFGSDHARRSPPVVMQRIQSFFFFFFLWRTPNPNYSLYLWVDTMQVPCAGAKCLCIELNALTGHPKPLIHATHDYVNTISISEKTPRNTFHPPTTDQNKSQNDEKHSVHLINRKSLHSACSSSWLKGSHMR